MLWVIKSIGFNKANGLLLGINYVMTSRRKYRLLIALVGSLLVISTYVVWRYASYDFDYDQIQVLVTDPNNNPVPGVAINLQYGAILLIPSPKGGSGTTDLHGVAYVQVVRNVACEFIVLGSKLPQYSPLDGYGFGGTDFRRSELASAEKGTFQVFIQYLDTSVTPATRNEIRFKKNGRSNTAP